MFIVGNNLKELVKKYQIVDDVRDVGETCIELKLHNIIKRLITTQSTNTLKYGERIPSECIRKENITEHGIVIEPKEALLACSSQRVIIPKGYMGMVQTKGSLARLFVFAQFSDSQVDSGFSGRITFELFNASNFNIILQEGQKIANLYLIPASDKNVNSYKGKYNNASEPTIQEP